MGICYAVFISCFELIIDILYSTLFKYCMKFFCTAICDHLSLQVLYNTIKTVKMKIFCSKAIKAILWWNLVQAFSLYSCNADKYCIFQQ